MGIKELRRQRTVRRIWESVIATVLGGLIVGTMTSLTLRPAPVAEPAPVAAAQVVQPSVTPLAATPTAAEGPLLAMPGANESAAPRALSVLPLPLPLASAPAPIPSPSPPRTAPTPNAIPIGSILLYEDFSRYREGEATGWGPNTFIKTGTDRRHWLVSNMDGAHPVGCRIRLPDEFYFECRYAAYIPEVTRGVLGWWKEPVGTRISFLGQEGGKYTIQWVIKCGNDVLRPNPLGSATLYVRKCFHTVTLPDGTTHEIEALRPTGMLRIESRGNALKVFVDGQYAAGGTVGPLGQLAGFEIDVVKARNGTLFFTDFKIGR